MLIQNLKILLLHSDSLDSFPLPLIDELYKWKGISKLLLTTSGELRKTANKNLGFPADKNAHAIKMKEGFTQLLKSLDEAPTFD